MLSRSITLPLVAVVAFTLAGCSAAADDATPPAADPASADSPVTVDNCGFDLTVAAAPERIVTIKSTSTEMLLALGLGDRIIGTGFPDGDVPEKWSAEAADIPLISEFAPSQEAVIALEPDFVYGGWESNFTAETAGERPVLQNLGIDTYVSPAACKEPGYQPEKLTFDEVFSEIAEAGTVFGAEAAAAEVVADQEAELAAIDADSRGLSALWYSSGTDTPYVGAGIGAPQMMLDALGLENIAADVNDTWTSLSWEAIVDADPDVIVLVDASWNSADSKIAALEANPATSGLSAVENGRYLRIPFAAGEAGVRNVEATADLATQLAALSIP
ncbi:iron complex transport system substrate-binding protein [Glaciihabitans tibetensis]|uniref:Iron complex transport system substrate-binding protein n=1 Tax=Glaciihabitans tibetensis TaxID=1266600 RepID=A0A2T0VI37_9MICO|nr:putative F420-0 ABC transporter substrate-binding protein [Glaciihabitans tibetensis]PRY69900.1 iron complex transport system substrate-binding protein [Glaciihabitans tibetensis]